jgi:methylmalonyl-CoA/ethylmalonyl-CoA epimerase
MNDVQAAHPAHSMESINASWRFDHLGLVVKSVDKARRRISNILAISEWTPPIVDAVNGVHLQFGRDAAGMVYELLEPLGPDSPVAGALQSGNNTMLNHIAYLVPDLAAGAAHMRACGAARTADPKPAIAYGGRPIQFFVTPLKFIIELIEAPGHVHPYASAQP